MTSKHDVALARQDLALADAEQQLTLEELRQSILIDAHKSLENIAASLEGMVADQTPMTPAFAQTTQQAIDVVSGGALSKDMVSLESRTLTAEAQTQLSLENLVETLKSLWEKIKLAVKNAIRAVGDFITKMLDGLSQMDRKIEDLKQANKRQAQTIKKASFTLDRPWATLEIRDPTRLMISGKVDLRTIRDGARLVRTQLLEGTTTYYGLVGKYYEQIEAVVSSGQPLGSDEFARFVDQIGSSVKDADRLNRTVMSKELFPGDKRVQVTVEEQGEFVLLGKLKMTTDSKARPMEKTFVDTPNADWVSELLNTAEEIVKSLMKSRREVRRSLLDRREDVLAKLDGIYKTIGMDTSSAEGKRFKHYMKLIDKDHVNSAAKIDRYMYSYVRALVDIVDGVVKLKYRAMAKKGLKS